MNVGILYEKLRCAAPLNALDEKAPSSQSLIRKDLRELGLLTDIVLAIIAASVPEPPLFLFCTVLL